MQKSTSEHASSGDLETITFSSVNLDWASLEISKMLTLHPNFKSLFAIGVPIVPRPIKAIFFIYSSKLYKFLFLSSEGNPP